SGLEGDDEALPIRTRARVLGATVRAGETLEYRFSDAGRLGYLVPAVGRVEVNGTVLDARDGAAIRDETVLRITALEDAELVLVDASACPPGVDTSPAAGSGPNPDPVSPPSFQSL